jgi:hypothetical protein
MTAPDAPPRAAEYYMLGCFGPLEEDSTEIRHVPRPEGVSWNSGARIDVPVPQPLRMELDPQHPGVLLPMYHKGVLVFSDAMVAALRDAGVDNLELFDAVIDDPFTGRPHTDYKVVNIVGAISAADLGKSKHRAWGEPLYDVDFDGVVIDPRKARGALMFRLAENVAGIVVHRRVKEALERAGIPYLDFYLPEEWVG